MKMQFRALLCALALFSHSALYAQSITNPPNAAGTGTVTSVGVGSIAGVTTSGGAVTTNGSVTQTLNTQTANTIFAAPSGSTGAPTFRALAAADLTAPTTNSYPGLAVSQDFLRGVVGGFPVSDQYSGVGYQINAIVGAVTTPSGTVTGAHIFDSGVSGYAQTNNLNRDAIGVYGEAGILVAGASAYGLNTEAINCENHSVSNCGAGHGLNMGQNWSIEADISLYKVGAAAPTGSASGVSAVVYAETQPNGTFTGFQCVQNTGLSGSQPWKTCLQVFDGTASQAAIQIGATAVYTSTALGSMSEYFNTYNSSGTLISVPLYADSSQAFHVGTNNSYIDGATNPALAIHNTGASTWYLISNSSNQLQIYNGSVSPHYFSATNETVTVPASFGTIAGGGFGTAITIALGANAGTGATAVCFTGHVCDNLNGTVLLTTGTSPAAGAQISLTFGLTRANNVNCIFSGPASFYGLNTSTTVAVATTAAALTASTAYQVAYVCMGN